jgi:hypothetical protein
MDRTFARSLLLVLAFTGVAARPSYAAQPVVKSLAHDASAHNSWANDNRDRWRKSLLGKKDSKVIRLAPLRTRTSTAAANAPQ